MRNGKRVESAKRARGRRVLRRVFARRIQSGHGSDVEPDGSHERERVAFLDDTFPKGVIEMHRAVLEMIFEMIVVESTLALRDDLRECEIMRRDDAEGAGRDESADDGLCADSPIVGICAVKNFVEQEEGGRG